MTDLIIDPTRAALNLIVNPLFDDAQDHIGKARVAVQPAQFKLHVSDIGSAMGHLDEAIEAVLKIAEAIFEADPSFASQHEATSRLLARRDREGE